MTMKEIENYCLAKPGAFLDYPFGPDVTIIKVKSENSRAKIFTQIFTLKGEPKITLSCDIQTGELYRTVYPGKVTRGYHCPPVQQPYFNTISLDGTIPDDELINMIDLSYTIVVGKLPKKYQKELEDAINEA